MTTFTKAAKPTTSFKLGGKPGINAFLQKEDTFYLLLEDGGKIIIALNASTSFTKPSKPTTPFTKELKP